MKSWQVFKCYQEATDIFFQLLFVTYNHDITTKGKTVHECFKLTEETASTYPHGKEVSDVHCHLELMVKNTYPQFINLQIKNKRKKNKQKTTKSPPLWQPSIAIQACHNHTNNFLQQLPSQRQSYSSIFWPKSALDWLIKKLCRKQLTMTVFYVCFWDTCLLLLTRKSRLVSVCPLSSHNFDH